MIALFRHYKILLITFYQLGVMSIARVVLYRLQLRIGYYKNTQKIKPFVKGDVYFTGSGDLQPPQDIQSTQTIISCANNMTKGTLQLFSHFDYHFESVPNWFYDPFTNQTHYDDRHWTLLNEFGLQNSDVKSLWETSRFGWAPTLAQAFLITKDKKYLNTLNNWIKDWCDKNPANQGIQWKCGQECSLRLLHFMSTLRLLKNLENPQQACVEFVERHIERIASTTFYAQAQRNNHLTSEAAALYIGGKWLLELKCPGVITQDIAKKYHRKGLKLLEWASNTLIYDDGSFAQHSVVYHRVMLETLSFCEVWRRYFSLPNFSEKFYIKAQKATQWLFWFTDPESGDAPNLGGNDGAQILNLGQAKYRDFRSCVQLASQLFHGECYYGPGKWDEHFNWHVDNTERQKYNPHKRVSKTFAQGGYYIHISDTKTPFWFLLRLPMYKDRPAHSDALHFDLWSNGENLLRDSGSYSYSAGDKTTQSNLKGVVGHNTFQFGGYDQMPLLSRFLFGCWLRGRWSTIDENENQVASARYTDQWGHTHTRMIHVNCNKIKVIDEINSRPSKFTLRWHLGQWPSSDCNLTINSDKVIDIEEETQNQFSLKYLEMENGNCISAKGAIENCTRIITSIHFK